MTAIEKLYYGHIRPHERIVDPESRSAVLQDLLVSSDEDLMRLQPENCRGTYEAFKAAYDELYELAQKEAFADGLSLGLQLGFECLGRNTEQRKDGAK